ncbi:integrase arm-type DNA-binding domain-containing protein [Desulfovibrio sp. OttesenSCG-928-G15]|nr:integrase arm-type DNA-binding domain-containing protein [Desulfovibrio sp. OttesenSCG-928-G15]
MRLTDTAIKAFKPKDKPYREFDGGGMYLEITPKGGKLWRLKYRFGGKEKRLSFGVYPTVGLKEARERREQAKKLLSQGIDPGLEKKETKAAAIAEQQKQENTFQFVAMDWFNTYAPDLTEKHALKLRRYLEGVFFPAIGGRPVAELLPADILAAVQAAQGRGRIHTAHRLTQLAGQVLQHAFIKGFVSVNVARGITGALQPLRTTSYAAITDPKEIGRLLRAIDNYAGYPSITYFLKILPYLFTRPGELRVAEWSEVNFEESMLTIPRQRMKTRKLSNKDHRVPLARQVVALLRELHAFSGGGRFLFPGIRAKTDTISDAGPLNALRDMGYDQNTMTLHGFRSMASTRLNEMGVRPDLVEAQLAHKDPDSVRMVYNRAEYLNERREMMQRYADYLDELRGQSAGSL